jgi:hypothetical protein
MAPVGSLLTGQLALANQQHVRFISGVAIVKPSTVTFDILRDPNEHVGFGGGGPHHCLGSILARMEIYVLLEEMARRMPTLELVGDAQPLRSNFIAGIKHMQVKYPAGKREVS